MKKAIVTKNELQKIFKRRRIDFEINKAERFSHPSTEDELKSISILISERAEAIDAILRSIGYKLTKTPQFPSIIKGVNVYVDPKTGNEMKLFPSKLTSVLEIIGK